MRKLSAAACIAACLYIGLASVASAQTTPPAADPATQAQPAATQAATTPAKTKMTSQQKIAVAAGALSAFMKVIQDAKAATPPAGATPTVQP